MPLALPVLELPSPLLLPEPSPDEESPLSPESPLEPDSEVVVSLVVLVDVPEAEAEAEADADAVSDADAEDVEPPPVVPPESPPPSSSHAASERVRRDVTNSRFIVIRSAPCKPGGSMMPARSLWMVDAPQSLHCGPPCASLEVSAFSAEHARATGYSTPRCRIPRLVRP